VRSPEHPAPRPSPLLQLLERPLQVLELLPGLRKSTTPKLLVWGEDDQFQTVDYAERFAAEIPATRLVRILRAGHIPMENEPSAVAHALGDFFAGR